MTTESFRDEQLDAIADRVIERLPMEQLAAIVAGKLPLDLLVDMIMARMRAPGLAAPVPRDGQAAVPRDALMEPFFQQSQTAQSILRLLPVPHKRKWTFFFSDWGCLRCGRGENEGLSHATNGFCQECYPLVHQRLAQSIRKRIDENASRTTEEAISKHRQRPLRADDLAQLTPDTIMEPWFLPKQIETAISQLVPISKRRKWRYFFLDWGCLRCGRTDVIHHCHGLCKRCHLWIYNHLRTSIDKHFAQDRPTPDDLTAKLTLRASTAQRILAGDEVLPVTQAPEPAIDSTAPPDLWKQRLWKKRLGRGCARIIDALTDRGELSTSEIATITGLTVRTVQDNLDVLRRNTLIETRYGRHVLRKPCEECRQVRQTLFQPKKPRPAKRLPGA